jgi:protein-L-isoaspartate(D-aspartate) O-methyltransferase
MNGADAGEDDPTASQTNGPAAGKSETSPRGPAAFDPVTRPDPTARARTAMVREQIEARGVRDERVLEALRTVPRHEFVPEDQRPFAYEDRALPIGYRQTISQPFVVAAMSDALELEGGERVLEVGTGSGYQAAILARLVGEVYTIEIVPELAERAARDLARLGFGNVHVRHGDGYRGWPEHAPFDAVIVTAAPDHVPQPLLDQLVVGGRLVIPVGRWGQELVVLTKEEGGVRREELFPVRFVPMVGEAQERRE